MSVTRKVPPPLCRRRAGCRIPGDHTHIHTVIERKREVPELGALARMIIDKQHGQ